MAKRLNVQLARLKQRNGNAFMFVDEPGLQFLFSAMAGYGDLKANDIGQEQLVAQGLSLTCCLVNPDRERTVERAFASVIRMADLSRSKYLP